MNTSRPIDHLDHLDPCGFVSTSTHTHGFEPVSTRASCAQPTSDPKFFGSQTQICDNLWEQVIQICRSSPDTIHSWYQHLYSWTCQVCHTHDYHYLSHHLCWYSVFQSRVLVLQSQSNIVFAFDNLYMTACWFIIAKDIQKPLKEVDEIKTKVTHHLQKSKIVQVEPSLTKNHQVLGLKVVYDHETLSSSNQSHV